MTCRRQNGLCFQWIAVFIFFFFGASRLHAGTRVVTVLSQDDNPLLVHVISELEAMGFTADVQLADRESATVPPATVGTLRLAPGGAAVTVVVEKREEIVQLGDEGSYSLTALRAVELLRVFLMTIDDNSDARPAAASPAPRPSSHEPPAEHRLRLSLGPAVGYGFRGFSPTLQLSVGADVAVTTRLSVLICGQVPTFGMTMAADEGDVTIHTGFVGVGPAVRLPAKAAPVSLTAGMGAGLLVLRMKGNARVPYIDSKETVRSSLVFARIELVVPVYHSLSFQAAALLGEAFPEPVIRLAGREAETAARPILFATAGIAVGLF